MKHNLFRAYKHLVNRPRRWWREAGEERER
jgi:hypothetical protein